MSDQPKSKLLNSLMLSASILAINSQAADIDFNRDIRPILSDQCFHCHGPDPETREADLRLDQETEAKESAIIEGNISESELIRRILSSDLNEVMPPHDSGKQLKAEQIQLLKRWVSEGAQWAKHWAFETPIKAVLPNVSRPAWPQNAIDHFVLARLDAERLSPSPAANKATLARRLAFDLTGLPLTSNRVRQFVETESPEAYQQLVEEVLASKHFGERMAMEWLDAARYADSDGYQADATRQNWPWRDWVIDSFNNDMPFNQFTIEQFAGDLFEDATPEQVLATCFHRNHMHNGEGGRDPEESRVEYVLDRVNTTGTVWMGLTLGCAQCHSHKYDPISQTEYYQLNAFFNSIDENGKAGGGAAPFLKYSSPHVEAGLNDSIAWLQQSEAKLQQIRGAELKHFDTWLEQQKSDIANAENTHQSWKTFPPELLRTTGGTELSAADGVLSVSGRDPRHDDYLITVAPDLPRITGMRLTVLPAEFANGKLARSEDGHVILTNLKVRLRSSDGTRERDVAIAEAVADYQAVNSGRVYGPIDTVLDDDPRTGWMTTGTKPTERRVAAFVFAQPIVFADDESLVVELRQRSLRGYSNLQKFSLEFTDEASPAAKSLDRTPLEQFAKTIAASQKLRDNVRAKLESQFLADCHRFQEAEAGVVAAKKRKSQYDSAGKPQSVTVLKQRDKPRTTHVLVRGVWNNKGDEVDAATPEAISVDGGVPKTRRELADWLVSRNNPLTARVIVNRNWQMYFGYGLVRTPGDFGTQGEPPTHPELLDWLAVEFMDSGWNVKHIQRLIVTSATYQQSSDVSEEVLQRDPNNRLLARATRFRLPSWMIRDSALAFSGLLSNHIGGPPVFAFQPEGAWLDATMGRFRYEPSVGTDRYRRSIYTFWRRSVGPTGMFDASKRRVCEVRSVRTNTPLQALNLLNDETFVEAAKALANATLQLKTSPAERIENLFESVLHRKPQPQEAAILGNQFQMHLAEYRSNPEMCNELMNVGQMPFESEVSPEAAAFVMLATTILNLDEAITHE